MSTVLTNGIIIPDNGNRNWGGDLANNWNILDLNVGYMNDVKNRVTTLENSVAENTANIQINTSNISALQTSKQNTIDDLETIRAGASLGATAVQPSVLSNYLPLTGGHITGNLVVDSDSHGWKPGFEWLYNNERYAYIHPLVNEASGDKSLYIQANASIILASQILSLSVSNTDGSNTHQNALTFRGELDGTFNFYSDNPANFGTSNNKWKTFNGINPGALSLPDYTQSVTLSFAIDSPIAIAFDGFIKITLNVSNNSYFSIFVNDQEVYVGQSATKPTVTAFVPVSQNDIVKIKVVEGEYTGFGSAVLFKNKGDL